MSFRFLDLALAGQGRVLFVTGEAGRGKTALIQEFVRLALEKEIALAVAGGNCNAYSGVGDPYLPFREILGLLTGDVEARLMAGGITQTQAQRLWNLKPYTIQTLLKTGPDLIDTVISGSDLVARTRAEASGGASRQIQLEEVVARKVAERGTARLFAQWNRHHERCGLLPGQGAALSGERIETAGEVNPGRLPSGSDRSRHGADPMVDRRACIRDLARLFAGA